MKVAHGLGIQSYCYRGFKPVSELIAKVKETGLSTVEICAVHADFNSPDTFGAVIDEVQGAGLRIVSIGVERMSNLPADENRFRFAQQAGARHMAVDFNLEAAPECYRAAETLAEKYDMRLAIHNHGGNHWLGSAPLIEHVLSQTSERIGLCLDTAWCLHSHGDPVKWVEKFGKRLYGVHIKDFIFDRTGKHADVVVGTGNLDLTQFGAALESVGFDGYAVLEYEGDVSNPVPALKECVEKVRACIPQMVG